MTDEHLHAKKFHVIGRVMLPRYSGGVVLDVGGGDEGFRKRGGYFPQKLFPKNVYHSIDILQLRGVSVCADAQHLPFRDESVGMILCTQVLEHVIDPLQVVKECYRILRWGQYVFISAPEIAPFHESPLDLHRFTIKDLIGLCTDAGFLVTGMDGEEYQWRNVDCKKNWIVAER